MLYIILDLLSAINEYKNNILININKIFEKVFERMKEEGI